MLCSVRQRHQYCMRPYKPAHATYNFNTMNVGRCDRCRRLARPHPTHTHIVSLYSYRATVWFFVRKIRVAGNAAETKPKTRKKERKKEKNETKREMKEWKYEETANFRTTISCSVLLRFSRTPAHIHTDRHTHTHINVVVHYITLYKCTHKHLIIYSTRKMCPRVHNV